MSGVLHVCLTNLSRSAMAEAIMRSQLREALGVGHDVVPVLSAGLAAHPGAPLDLRTGAELSRRGLALEGFGAQPLSQSMIAASALVLTATRAQRDEVAAILPAALFRTFTWRELAALLHGIDPSQVPGVTANERTRALAEIATRRRRILTPLPGDQLDVPQSWGRNPLRYRKLARQIEDALAVVVRLVVPPSGLAAAAESNLLPAMRVAPEAPLSDLFDGVPRDGVEPVVGEWVAQGATAGDGPVVDAGTDPDLLDDEEPPSGVPHPPLRPPVPVFSDATPPMGVPRPSVPPPVVVQLPPDVVTLPGDDAPRVGRVPSPPGHAPGRPATGGVRPQGGIRPQGGVRPVSGISEELAAETAAAIDAVLAQARGRRPE